MRRVVLLGPGGAGKSVLGRAVGDATGVPYVELDELFWSADLQPTPPERWAAVQRTLRERPTWILDGDLGPDDVLSVRLSAADTVVLLDLPLVLCLWRSLRRSRQRLDYWRWLVTWRRRWRPRLLGAIAEHAPGAELIVCRSRRDVDRTRQRMVRALRS